MKSGRIAQAAASRTAAHLHAAPLIEYLIWHDVQKPLDVLQTFLYTPSRFIIQALG
jgi:hypothetical protein